MRLARVVALGLAVGCAPRSTAPVATHPSSCPACECKCECDTAPGVGVGVGVGVDGYERDELFAAAQRKASQGDGKGCLEDLEQAKALDPRPRFDSAQPESPYAHTRAQCLMLAGQCAAGKTLARSALEQGALAQWGPEHIDKTVETYVSMHCRGKMSDREALLQSLMELQRGAYMSKKTVRFCDSHYERIKRLRSRVKPRNDDDSQIIDLDIALVSMAPRCYQRAGDCKRAWAVYRETALVAHPEVYAKMPAAQREESLRLTFDSTINKCKGAS